MIPVIRIQGGRIVIPSIRQITGANIINDIEVSTIREVDIPKSFLFGSAAVEIVSNMLEFSLVYALLSTITTKVSIEEGGKKERQQQIT